MLRVDARIRTYAKGSYRAHVHSRSAHCALLTAHCSLHITCGLPRTTYHALRTAHSRYFALLRDAHSVLRIRTTCHMCKQPDTPPHAAVERCNCARHVRSMCALRIRADGVLQRVADARTRMTGCVPIPMPTIFLRTGEGMIMDCASASACACTYAWTSE